MPPPLLLDLTRIDLNHIELDQRAIYELLPHRHEFMVLDGVCHVDVTERVVVGFAEISEDKWWCKGHVPHHPLLPGVLMIEMAAQLIVVLAKRSGEFNDFIALGGVDQCKFREAVAPKTRLYFISKATEIRSRRIRCDSQGVLDGRVVFEASLTGMMMDFNRSA